MYNDIGIYRVNKKGKEFFKVIQKRVKMTN